MQIRNEFIIIWNTSGTILKSLVLPGIRAFTNPSWPRIQKDQHNPLWFEPTVQRIQHHSRIIRLTGMQLSLAQLLVQPSLKNKVNDLNTRLEIRPRASTFCKSNTFWLYFTLLDKTNMEDISSASQHANHTGNCRAKPKRHPSSITPTIWCFGFLPFRLEHLVQNYRFSQVIIYLRSIAYTLQICNFSIFFAFLH